MCLTCNHALPLTATTIDKPARNAQVRAWLTLLGAHIAKLRGSHGGRGMRVARAAKIALAERLATVGGPGDPAAVAVYEQIRVLLLTPRRHKRRNGHTILKLVHIKEALAVLPPDPIQLAHVAETMKLWRSITGRTPDRGESFKPDTVITTMLAISNPEPYIRQLHARGFSSLAGMFHPNTLARAKGKDTTLRGVFDKQNTAYWKQLEGQLNIVGEEA